METPLLKGSLADSFTPGSSIEVAVHKVTVQYRKEIYLLLLKHLLEKQEPVGTLSRDRDAGSQYFWYSPSILQAWALAGAIFFTLL